MATEPEPEPEEEGEDEVPEELVEAYRTRELSPDGSRKTVDGGYTDRGPLDAVQDVEPAPKQE